MTRIDCTCNGVLRGIKMHLKVWNFAADRLHRLVSFLIITPSLYKRRRNIAFPLLGVLFPSGEKGICMNRSKNRFYHRITGLVSDPVNRGISIPARFLEVRYVFILTKFPFCSDNILHPENNLVTNLPWGR